MKHVVPHGLASLVAVSTLVTGGCSFAIADAPASNTPTTQPTTATAPVDLKDETALKAALGKMVSVEGVVKDAEWGSSGKVLRIQFEGGEKSHFMAVIFQKDRPNFDLAYNGNVAKTLVGKNVRVEGKLATYKEHLEIIIKAPSQLTLVKQTVEETKPKSS